jgi:heterodisulfide reductase subunit A2
MLAGTPQSMAAGPETRNRALATPYAVLVIGGGIAGIQAALDVANSGMKVILVERQPSIGGHMAQLSETFPTLDCSQCILTPRTVEISHHDNVTLMTYSTIEKVDGEAGHFTVTIRRKARYVDWEKCTGCGICQEKCPWRFASDFDRQLAKRKVIYTLSPQAVPNKPVIERSQCAFFARNTCRACEKFCPVGAIDFCQEDESHIVEVASIIVATGYDLYRKDYLGEYGAGKLPDVIDNLQFERLLAASGPTAGQVKRPSDGVTPKSIVFIQCAGSRDPQHALSYCSKACCMITAKHALMYKHKVPDGQVYVFYMDVRAAGKGYEEFVQRAMGEEGVLYLRGRVSRLFRDEGKIIVWGADTLSGRKLEVEADMVVLATAMTASRGSGELATILNIATDEHGFYTDAGVLHPVETAKPGVFIAGAGRGPVDIPEAVAQASAAAAKVIALSAELRAQAVQRRGILPPASASEALDATVGR